MVQLSKGSDKYNSYGNQASKGAGKQTWQMYQGLLNLGTLDRPSAIAQMSDAMDNNYNIAWARESELIETAFRHSKTCNYLMWDNHVESADMKKVSLFKIADEAAAWKWPWW